MLLQLSLPKDKIVWALSRPVSREYMHPKTGTGYQDVSLILGPDSGPVMVETEEYPDWAKQQILSSIKSGEIINTGDSIGKKIEDKNTQTAKTKQKTRRSKNKK